MESLLFFIGIFRSSEPDADQPAEGDHWHPRPTDPPQGPKREYQTLWTDRQIGFGSACLICITWLDRQ